MDFPLRAKVNAGEQVAALVALNARSGGPFGAGISSDADEEPTAWDKFAIWR